METATATPADVQTAWMALDKPRDFAALETNYKRILENETDDAVRAAYDRALDVLFDTPETDWPTEDTEERAENTKDKAPPPPDPYPDAKDANDDPRAMAVVNAIKDLPGIDVEICGRWVWAGGATREHKDALKAMGMQFARKKIKWYWRPPEHKHRRRGKKTMPMEYIRQKYGSRRPDDDN